MSNTQTYNGSCQCGAVTYTAQALKITEAMSCNCSRCGRIGSLLAFVSDDQFTLLSGEDKLTQYNFNENVIDHLFCKTCGVQSFSRGKDGEGNAMVALNVRCLKGIDLEKITITEYDGAAL